MASRRVVALTDGSVLAGGILSVLREHGDIEVVVIEGGRDHVYRRVREAEPDVVIVPTEPTGRGRGLSIQRLLLENPRSAVIALSLTRPEMRVFRARQVEGATVDDLLRVLEGAPKAAPTPAGSSNARAAARREALALEERRER